MMVRFILASAQWPGMLGLWQPMVDLDLAAGVFEGVGRNGLSSLQGGLMSGAAELALTGVAQWVPLSGRTVWTL